MDSIANQAARGDRDAMGRIVGEHYASVYRFCARRIGADLAEDAAQETFIVAWKRLKSFEGSSSLGTWLFGIANNACRSLMRKRRMETTYALHWMEQQAGESPEKGLADAAALRWAMGRLSGDHREVVLLHEIEEMTYGEIAQVLGVPEGTVKSRLNAAFQHLRKMSQEAQI